jgi:hypothetical protein
LFNAIDTLVTFSCLPTWLLDYSLLTYLRA